MGTSIDLHYWKVILLWQSYWINEQKFLRTKDGGGAPATPVPFSLRIAIEYPYYREPYTAGASSTGATPLRSIFRSAQMSPG